MAEQYIIQENDKEIILLSNEIDLKVDSARNLYAKIPKKHKKFINLNTQIPLGFTREEKQIWLVRYRRAIINRLSELPQEDTKQEEGVKVTITQEEEEDEENEYD